MSEATNLELDGELLAEVEQDPTTFINRYPRLDELVAKGGREGVEYCLVAGSNLRKFSSMDNNVGDRWSTINGVPTLTVVGPAGRADSVVLMGRGNPIYGASDFNGVRKYFVDVLVEETTGIPSNPDSPIATKKSNLPIGRVKEEGKGGRIDASKEGQE